MASQTVSLDSLTPAQQAELDRPIRHHEPAELTTDYQIHLAHIGLHKAAQRDADTAQSVRWFKVDDYDRWKTRLYTPMTRTDEHHAKILADEQVARFRRIPQVFCVCEGLTRLTFSFPGASTGDGSRQAINTACFKDRQKIKMIRGFLHRYLLGSTSKIGTDGGDADKRTLKVIYPSPLTHEQALILQGANSVGISFVFHKFDESQLEEELVSWASPDLPSDDRKRAEHELMLKGIHQVGVHGDNKIRGQFAKDYTPIADSLPTMDDPNHLEHTETPRKIKRKAATPIPRSPRTHRPALFMSPIVDISTPVEDILDSEWIPIPQIVRPPG